MTPATTVGQRLLSFFGLGLFGLRGGALAETVGHQLDAPSAPLIGGTPFMGADSALQLATVWACVNRRANIIASLPFFAYDVGAVSRRKTPAVGSRLYQLLHDSPNERMTPFQFWRSMLLNHDLRGNAYARIVRAADGEATALWPMPADQVEQYVANDGSVWYAYRLASTTYVYPADDVLHLQDLGNGTHGLAKLEFMSSTIAEGQAQAMSAQAIFANGGKPSAVLMTDKTLNASQRASLQARFGEIAANPRQRLFVLEAGFEYQAINVSAEQQQLLESRAHTTEEICRWFDVPPVLVYHSNQTAWGSGIEQIIEGFHKFTIGPLAVSIEQCVRKRVLTPGQRAGMTAELNLDALLRGTPAARYQMHAIAVQNGINSRDEIRQLENWPEMGGAAAVLTAQTNLAPLDMLGKIGNKGAGGEQPPIAQ